ncbi:MAG: nitroreductase [Erysipelotrichaceae bacterium]|nr:nitroreductase [Erysipelotrichaceae bacterium]
MNLKDAMKERHTVRKFKDIPLTDEHLKLISEKVDELNNIYNLNMELKLNDPKIIPFIFRLGFSRNAANYITLAGPKGENAPEKLGYCSSILMLYLTTLGIDTWWIGGTFHKRKLEKDDQVLPGILVVGYGESHGKAHRSKPLNRIILTDQEAPEWFINGAKATLLAPTALNKQDYLVMGKDGKVVILNRNGDFTEVNRGILRHHFELGAGTDNFTWMEPNIEEYRIF